MRNPLEGLGLEVAPAAHDLSLSHGVTLRYRTPTALDVTLARTRVAEVLGPASGLAGAAARYNLPLSDFGILADPDEWEGVGAALFAIELAVLIVTAVWRVEGDGETARRWEVAPDVAVLSWLLRQKGALDAFLKATDTASGSLIQPKKEHAPSPNGSSAAAARTAKDASAPARPAPGAKP